MRRAQTWFQFAGTSILTAVGLAFIFLRGLHRPLLELVQWKPSDHDRHTHLDRTGSRFTAIVIGAMQRLLMIVTAVAVLELFWLFFTSAANWLRKVDPMRDLQFAVKRSLAGVLMILLGLEILASLEIGFTQHKVRLKLILFVALIAVSPQGWVRYLRHSRLALNRNPP